MRKWDVFVAPRCAAACGYGSFHVLQEQTGNRATLQGTHREASETVKQKQVCHRENKQYSDIQQKEKCAVL